MAPFPDRKSLENMKRVDLQKLCKDYGVKANLKSEALIDLLMDTQKPTTRNAPTLRSLSTRRSTSRMGGPSRISSIIIHDTDDEASAGGEQREESLPQEEPESDASPSVPSGRMPVTRTRKAKEQTRLGVGRPVAAGGSGPRAITKSVSISKSKRGKNSKAMKPTEATILEEEGDLDTQVTVQEDSRDKSASETYQQSPGTISIVPADVSLVSLASIDKHVADALRPLHEQMKSLKSELELVQSLKTEFGQLKAQVDEIGGLRAKVEALTAVVKDLHTQTAPSGTPRKEAEDSLVSGSLPNLESTEMSSGSGLTTNLPDASKEASLSAPGAATRPHPGVAPSTLGKRHRESMASDMGNQEDEVLLSGLESVKPMRKRAKILVGDSSAPIKDQLSTKNGEKEDREEEEEEIEQAQSTPRVPSFTVFSGPEHSQEQCSDSPPTDRLPDFFAPPSPLMGSGPNFSRLPATSSSKASENQHPFSFSFPLISSAPTNSLFMPSFPYPEPPQSPSPAGTHLDGVSNHRQGERSNVFPAFGFPPGRPSHPSGSGFIDPTTLMRRPSDQKEVQSNINHSDVSKEVLAGPVESESSTTTSGTEVPRMKRTMYGTELEGDTRFGDFGVEGNFWTGGRY